MEEFQSFDDHFEEDPSNIRENRKNLGTLSEIDILRIFNSFTRGKSHERKRVIIPVGFPAAGKSFLLSSLFYYAKKETAKNWKVNFENQEPFRDGFLSANNMVEHFEAKEAYPQTVRGTVDIVGLQMEPNRKNLPISKFAFVDLAGDDLKDIKATEQGVFGDQITGILKSVQGSKPIFLMITPYNPILGDHNEDSLHYDFLNYIKMNLPNLFKESVFIVIVSQWDKNPNRDTEPIEQYIEEYRPQLCAQIKDSNTIYGEYSVADITSGKDNDGNEIVFFQQINKECPRRLWKMLYKINTGKDLEKSWWGKLFG